MGKEPTTPVYCCWCDKVHQYNNCQDEIEGLEPLTFLHSPDDGMAQAPVMLHVYFCSCGGTLAVITEEPHGSNVMWTDINY